MLAFLKANGFSRSKIEARLNYSENYITQTLSKGVDNTRFYNSIKKLHDDVKNGIEHVANSNVVNEPEVAFLGKDSATDVGLSAPDIVAAIDRMTRSMDKLTESRLIDSQTMARLVLMLEKAGKFEPIELPMPGESFTETPKKEEAPKG